MKYVVWLWRNTKGIRFHDVTFHYAAGDRDIIHHFSHDFRPATKTALMGETGIGKTTLFRLMLSFIRPDSGQIEIYGEGEQAQAVSETTRANFVFVPQGGLSEGQAQRIAIARGLLRPGNILLLDEISSALDEQTERELFTRLFAAYPQKTMLFITHRSAMTTRCDEVLNMCDDTTTTDNV